MATPVLITKLKNQDGGLSCVVQAGCSRAALMAASLVNLEALGVNIETLNIKDDSKERPRPSRLCVKDGSASQQAFPGAPVARHETKRCAQTQVMSWKEAGESPCSSIPQLMAPMCSVNFVVELP